LESVKVSSLPHPFHFGYFTVVVQAGRDEQKRKFEFGRKRVGGSKTNIEKRKTKNFSMTRVKALTKLRRSGSQKRSVKKKHLSKIKSQRMNKHH
jgi:hypothetical protein